jgi:hypothetical protein
MKASVDFDKTELEIVLESGDKLDDYTVYDGPTIKKTVILSQEDIDMLSAGMQ